MPEYEIYKANAPSDTFGPFQDFREAEEQAVKFSEPDDEWKVRETIPSVTKRCCDELIEKLHPLGLYNTAKWLMIIAEKKMQHLQQKGEL